MISAVVDHLWQSTLFVVVALLLTLALRNNAARVRYWVWLAASIKFLIPFSLLTMLGSQLSWREADPVQTSNVFFTVVEQIAEPLATPEIVLRAPQADSFDFMPIVLSLWLAGCIALLFRWTLSWMRVRSAVRASRPVEIHSPIAVRSTPIMSEPGVVGVFRPVLLLPEGIASRLSSAQLQAVLAHELCHVKRRDNLTAAIHMIVEALFWFHPMVWWIGARLVEERERACDEGVVELGNEPQAYAEGILKVCQFYMESKLACVAGVSGADLKRRVEAIMGNRIGTALGAAKKSLLAICLVMTVATPISLGLLTAAPKIVQAQQDGLSSAQNDSLSIELVPAGQGPHDDDSTATLVLRNQSVRALIAGAYQIQEMKIVAAPSWIDTTSFDSVRRGIKLKDLDIAEHNEVTALERQVLTETFGLKFHRETRPTSVYVLGLSDSGRNESALREVAPRYGGQLVKLSFDNGNPKSFPKMMMGGPIEMVVSRLSKTLGSVVLDHTGLQGAYTYNLRGDPTAANLPALLESELGLRLEQRTEPVELFVIDSIQQPSNASSIRVERPSSIAPRLKLSDDRLEMTVDPTLRRSQFHGEPMNMKFANINVRDLLENLTKVRGQAIVLDPFIQGRLSGDINNIPWDQVLDEIVRFKGWTMRQEGRVIYISALSGIQIPPSVDPIADAGRSTNFVVPVVAEVRGSQRGTTLGGMGLKFDGNTLIATNMTLKELIQTAFNPNTVPAFISGGPEWIDRTRFDVTIKLGGPMRLPDISGPNKDVQVASVLAQQLREQLRTLLAYEFKLVVRNEKRTSAYRLVALAEGPKLRVSNGAASVTAELREVRGSVVGRNVSVEELSAWLSRRLSMPVLDRTVLDNRYDFTFNLPEGSSSDDIDRLSASLSEQLGLELTPIKVDALVIDRAEKPANAI
jgi:bla regulator protein blaR1